MVIYWLFNIRVCSGYIVTQGVFSPLRALNKSAHIGL